MQSIILCGFMASGKSAVGRALARRLHLPYIDTDALLESTFHTTIPEMFAAKGEAYFRDREHDIAKIAAGLSDHVISTGGGMLTFPRNAALLKNSGTIVYLSRNFDTLYALLSRDTSRPLARGKSKEEIRALHDSRMTAYQSCARFTVQNDGTIEECVDKILSLLP